MREIPKRVLRHFVGEARYGELLSWAQEVRSGPGGRRRRITAELIRSQALKARFKGYVIEAAARRRTLERELAQLRYPEHDRPQLGVVAEMSGGSVAPSPWSGAASVIITNFNYGRYVGQAIDSVLRQTHERVELVVVDDASSDSSTEQLERVLPHASVPWQLIRLKHNIGLSAARNVGVKVARGEFVFILDADNHVLPQCIEEHLRAAQENKADAVYGLVQTFGRVSRLHSDGEFSAKRLAEGPYIDAMALFRRSALVEMGLYSTEPALSCGWEDYELWVRFAAQARRVAFIPRVMSHYRLHKENMVSITSLDTRGEWTYLFSAYPSIFGDMSAEEEEREAEQRARLLGEYADSTFKHEPDVPVSCGCVDVGASHWKRS